MNLGYNVISNNISGSEAALVQQCYDVYGPCLHPCGLSYCTKNALDIILNCCVDSPEVIGLQEINIAFKDTIKSYLQTRANDTYDFYESRYGTACIMLAVKSTLFGPGYPLTLEDEPFAEPPDPRTLQAIWFPIKDILLINLHAPHNIDIRLTLERKMDLIMNTITPNIYPERIIITGDFNDGQGTIGNAPLYMFNQYVTIPSTVHVTTCCDDVNYIYPGDYIMDSVLYNDTYYGYPPGYIRKQPLMSDHDPIMYRTWL